MLFLAFATLTISVTIPLFVVAQQPDRSIVLVIDASGSMWDNNKIGQAKTAAINVVNGLDGRDEVALVVFYGCGSIVLEQGFTTDYSAVISAINAITPLGSTPIAASISYARNYMENQASGKSGLIIVLTDGGENCGGNPRDAASTIKTIRIPVKLHIIGFNIDEENVKQELEEAANEGGGSYFDADDQESLQDALEKAIQKEAAIPWTLIGAAGAGVGAAGIAGAGLAGRGPLGKVLGKKPPKPPTKPPVTPPPATALVQPPVVSIPEPVTPSGIPEAVAKPGVPRKPIAPPPEPIVAPQYKGLASDIGTVISAGSNYFDSVKNIAKIKAAKGYVKFATSGHKDLEALMKVQKAYNVQRAVSKSGLAKVFEKAGKVATVADIGMKGLEVVEAYRNKGFAEAAGTMGEKILSTLATKNPVVGLADAVSGGKISEAVEGAIRYGREKTSEAIGEMIDTYYDIQDSQMARERAAFRRYVNKLKSRTDLSKEKKIEILKYLRERYKMKM